MDARTQIDAQIQLRRDLDAVWRQVDPVLRDGEVAYSKDILRMKVGDGTSRWSELPYLPIDSTGGTVDLTAYAKSADLLTLSNLLASMWSIDEQGNLVTDKQVIIKNNLVVHGDQTAGGEGVAVVSVTGILIDGKTYRDIDSDGLIDLTAAFDNLQASITLDTEMSDESTNGVQNKVIKAYVDRLSLYDIVGEVETPQGNGVLWMVDADGNIIADKHVIASNGLDVHGNQRISGNLIVEGDISA